MAQTSPTLMVSIIVETHGDMVVECQEGTRVCRFRTSRAVLSKKSPVFAGLICNSVQNGSRPRTIHVQEDLEDMQNLLLALHKDPVSVDRIFHADSLYRLARLSQTYKCQLAIQPALENWSLHVLCRASYPKVTTQASMVVIAFLAGMNEWFGQATRYVLMNWNGGFRELFEDRHEGIIPDSISAEMETRRRTIRDKIRVGIMTARIDTSSWPNTQPLSGHLHELLIEDRYYTGDQSVGESVSSLTRFLARTRIEMMMQDYPVRSETAADLPPYCQRISALLDEINSLSEAFELPLENRIDAEEAPDETRSAVVINFSRA